MYIFLVYPALCPRGQQVGARDTYLQFTWINFCYLVPPIFWGEFRIIFTNKYGLKKIPRTVNCPKNLHVKNEVNLWLLTSSKILVLVAQPISTDGGGPPAWAVDKRAELGWPSSREKGWPAVCKSGPRLCSLRYWLTFLKYWWQKVGKRDVCAMYRSEHSFQYTRTQIWLQGYGLQG